MFAPVFRAFLMSVALHAGVVSAADTNLERGLAALQKQDFAAARAILKPLAEQGDPVAQFALGQMHERGQAAEADAELATRWYHKAALQGFAPAQYNMGNAYKHGRGVPQSDKLAAYWWEQAALQDFAPAQFNLGTAYLFGRGVTRNEEKGREWRRKAAQNGFTPPQAPESPRDNADTWIGGRDPLRFTIQLLSTSRREPALRFIEARRWQHPIRVVEYRHRERSRYAVVYGDFPHRAAAEQALEALPEQTKRWSPWIRRFGDIQRVLP